MGRQVVYGAVIVHGLVDPFVDEFQCDYNPAEGFIELGCCPYDDCEDNPHTPIAGGQCSLGHDQVDVLKRRGHALLLQLDRGDQHLVGYYIEGPME